MMRSATLIALLLPALAAAQPQWNHPEDIPQPVEATVGLAGERPADLVRFLMAQGANAATLSPDGSQLAFSWSVTGHPQLWVVDAAGGWPRQLTFGSAITFFTWAPDGAHLLVGRDTEGDEREGYSLLSADGRSERQVLPVSDAFRVFGSFSPDGEHFVYASTERNGRDFDIYVADVASGETRPVFQAEFGFYPAAWQPGAERVLVAEVRGEDGNDLHLLDLQTGEMKPLFQPEISALFADLNWLPDGEGFVMATNVGREFTALASYDLASGELVALEAGEHDVESVTLSGDGRFLAWATNEGGYSVLHAYDRVAGAPLEAPELPRGVYQLRFARDASVLSVLVSGPGTPGDVYAWNPASGTLTHPVRASLAGLDPAIFVTPESHRFRAQDGVLLHGLLYTPDAERFPPPRPVVVDVHGGPTSQARPDWNAITQYLVDRGTAVLDVNVRGSTGFGKTYARLDNQEKRLDSVRDLVDTAAFLARDPRLDASRAAVMGGSYGGYMVNAVLGAHPGVFAAGVSFVGVSDWVRALEEASPGLKASDRIEYGDIREERWQQFYAENSPINTAGRIRVPMLVAHGANDPRDPVTESDRIVEAVRGNGVEVEYLRFPDEGHGVRKRENRVTLYTSVADFLSRELSAPGGEGEGEQR